MNAFFLYLHTFNTNNMKKYLFLTILSAGLLFASCGSDDSGKSDNGNTPENPENPGQPVTVKSEWEPKTIKLVKIVPLYTLDYPHTSGCTRDYLQLMSDNTAKFFHYEGTDCKVTEYGQAFQRSGNNVTVNVMGYEIKGVVKAETDAYMEIHSDISEYIPLIKAQFPQYEQYLSVLEGGTVILSLDKK